MQRDVTLRICECGKPLPIQDWNTQTGYTEYDGEAYYCNRTCLFKHSDITNQNELEQAYKNEQVYWTEWELERL